MPLNCFILGVLLNIHHNTLKTFSVQFIAMQCAFNALPRPVLATLIKRTSAQLFITQPRYIVVLETRCATSETIVPILKEEIDQNIIKNENLKEDAVLQFLIFEQQQEHFYLSFELNNTTQ
ncbi:hypothetical protein Tsp_04296 [Trichinella spiralis]|uniref:hypothetical protein n=1 Tax=Trichinella spiralis TaxID=6334 RepID=UPI0001EFC11E|nr:hypothetical protein Tsp_04296 [Trichinella spiralis]